MRDIEFHDSFTPTGGSEAFAAVTLSAGLTWLDVYAAASVDRDLVNNLFSEIGTYGRGKSLLE